MSDIQLDINGIIDSLSAEVAQITKRAIVAEAHVTARDKTIKELDKRIAELREENEQLEAQLDQARDVEKLKKKLDTSLDPDEAKARASEEDDIDFG